jgi:hypothetical protein
MTPTGNRFVTPRKGRRLGPIDNCRVVDDGEHIDRVTGVDFAHHDQNLGRVHKAEKMLKNCAF